MLSVVPVAGIDVGKQFLDLGFHPSAKPLRCDNTPAGIERLIDALRLRVALEAIGPYAYPVTTALAEAGFAVALANPRRVRAFRTAEGVIAKTDRQDRPAGRQPHRALCSAYARAPAPRASARSGPAQGALDPSAPDHRADRQEKTRLAQALDPLVADSHRAVIEPLEGACAAIEKELDAHITSDPGLARKRTILTSIPGIGRRIAAVLITGMPELGCLDRKAAASLAGMAPHPTQSGSHPGRHAIVGGRPCLRTAFYMAGMVAARSCPTFKIPYRAMRDAGKPGKVATGRRLVVLANALLKDNKTFADSKLMA